MVRGELAAALRWGTGLALGGLVARWALDPAHRPGAVEGNDFLVFHEGARGFAATGNPYGAGFVSPAPFALLLAPLAALPSDAAAAVWLGLSLLALVGLAAVSLHLAGIPPRDGLIPPLAAALVFWPANTYGLLLGQSSALVALLATLAVAAARPHPAAAGALLGFAAVAKPHLVLLLVLGLAADTWRRGRTGALAGAFLLTATALTALAALFSRRWVEVLLAGPPESWNYWGSTIGTNVFLSAALADRGAGWFLLAVLGTALVIGLAVWWRRAAPEPAQLAAALLAATLLVTPYAYPHDYVLLALPLVWIASRLRKLRARAALPALLVLGIVAWLGPAPASYDDRRFLALGLPVLLLAGALALPTVRDEADPRPGTAGAAARSSGPLAVGEAGCRR